MNFSEALEHVRHGKKIARDGWNGKHMWVQYFSPTAAFGNNNVLTHPFLVIEYPKGHPAYPNGSCVPWLASQTDILAEDWRTVL
jgi:hypothetical protein